MIQIDEINVVIQEMDILWTTVVLFLLTLSSVNRKLREGDAFS